MTTTITTDKLIESGIDKDTAKLLAEQVNKDMQQYGASQAWKNLLTTFLVKDRHFAAHQYLFESIYLDWATLPCPIWFPTSETIKNNHITQAMAKLGYQDYYQFQTWSANNRLAFWDFTIKNLAITFTEPYSQVIDLSDGVTQPHWLPGAKFNIIDSCFQHADNATAIICEDENGQYQKISYAALAKLVNRIANGFKPFNLQKGDVIAIDMPLQIETVAIYLASIKAGFTVCSIAESFAPDEIATRLRISKAKLIFTQDYLKRSNKLLPIYEKVVEAKAPQAIIFSKQQQPTQKIRSDDICFADFLSDNTEFDAILCQPEDPITILFSSGTTGDPKGIPWNHTTPIKCAADAYYHHNVAVNDVFAWPTSLGWMMGPFLIFACLINKATLAIYEGATHTQAFGDFVNRAKVTQLGVVPSLVRVWRETGCMESCDWSSVKTFTSTGECSNVTDMLYLSFLGGYKPIIEYCGGTEVVCYIAATLLQPCVPAAFTTPALGLDFVILDEQGKPSDNGEIGLIPPSLGFSTTLLNKDHYHVYYEDMPVTDNDIPLRRHGDQIKRIGEHYYRALGRVDDTMNLGAIKVSSAEIERVFNQLPMIKETAAIAITPKSGGPSKLIVYVVPAEQNLQKDLLIKTMQCEIKEKLNPLFKIEDIVLVDSLPRTASNKVMRRILRNKYQDIL